MIFCSGSIFVTPLLFRVILIVFYTIRITKRFDSKGMFNIKALAPDRAGGLSPLSELTLIQFYILIAFLPPLFIASVVLHYPLPYNFIYPLYFLFTFYAFYFPLYAPHKSMKEAKIKELTAITDKYEIVLNKFKTAGENIEENEKTQLLEELSEIRIIYKDLEKMPVWPFNFEIFVKFGAVFFTSLTAYLTQLLISFIK